MKAKKFNEFINEAKKPHAIVVMDDGKRLAIDNKDIQRLKSGKEVVGMSLEYAGQEEWVYPQFVKKIEESVDEVIAEGKVKVFLDKIVGKMVSGGFGPHTNHKMREEIKQKIEDIVKETMEKYDYIVESEDVLEEGVIQNLNSDDFDGADPKTIDVHNQGVGGVRSLQGHRDQVVRLLEEMLKEAKKAQKNHKMAHWHIDKVLGLADPQKMGGVLLPYLKNHQAAVEELESIRKRGGSGKNKTIPKGLI